MRRSRTFNAAPERTASETVEVIRDVIAQSLAASSVGSARVQSALDTAVPALLMLVSGRHLKDKPLTLVAADSVFDMYCRYDDGAVGGEENLNAVPGMASATRFKLYLPAPQPLTDIISGLIAGNEHLTTSPAPTGASNAAAGVARDSNPLDLAALKELL